MSDNYFVQNYGTAPVEEAPAEPPPQAPPPQEEVPPPQASGNYFQDTYVAPPPPPPPPTPASTSEATVDPNYGASTPPPPPPPPVGATPQPVDQAALQTMNPVERTLREAAPPALQGFIPDITGFQNQPTIQDKVGYAASGLNAPFDYGARRQGQRAADYATTGSPDTTLGGLDPGSLVQHPENVLDVIPGLASNVPGGGESELYSWAKDHPDRVVPDDPEATYNNWLSDTGRTLETGGIAGAAAGLIRGAAVDPSLPISMGLGVGEEAAANIARTAPELTGVARGVVMAGGQAAKGAQFAIDPIGETLARGTPTLLGKAIPGLGLGKGETERISGEKVGEVLQGTAMADREARNAATFTPPAAAATPPAGAAVPPAGPVVPPTNGAVPPTGAVIPPAAPLVPNGVTAVPRVANALAPNVPNAPNGVSPGGLPITVTRGPFGVERHLVGDYALDYRKMPNSDEYRWVARPKSSLGNSAQEGRGGLLQGTMGKGRSFSSYDEALKYAEGQSPRTPRVSTEGAPFGRAANGNAPGSPMPAALINRDGTKWTLPDGSTPPVSLLEKGAKRLAEIPPEDFTAFPAGRATQGAESQPNKWLAAMTERGYMYDDWPASRVGGTAQQRAAGKRFIDMEAQRIQTHGQAEVQRLLDNFEQAKNAEAQTGALANHNTSQYWNNRAESIRQAAEQAAYDTPFELSTGTKYAGTTNETPMRGAAFTPSASMPSADKAFTDTVQYFNTHGPEIVTSVRTHLLDMLQDPEAFSPDHPIYGHEGGIRQNMYQSGAWAKRLLTGDATPEAKALNRAAYDRYQAFRDLHESIFPNTTKYQLQGPFTPTSALGNRASDYLTLEEEAIVQQVLADTRAHLEKMGLGHVSLQYERHIGFGGAASGATGSFSPALDKITLAVGEAADAVYRETVGQFEGNASLWDDAFSRGQFDGIIKNSLYQTLNHETVHALRFANVINPDEWKTLVDEAHARGYGKWAQENYGPHPETGQSAYQYANTFDSMTRSFDDLDEEAVAEMFGDFALNKKVLSEQSRTIMQKIVDFFTVMVQSVRKNNAEGVMNKMLSGDIGQRAQFTARENPITGNSRYYQLGSRQNLLKRATGQSAMLENRAINTEIPDQRFAGLHLDAGREALLRGMGDITHKGVATHPEVVLRDVMDDVEELRFLAEANAHTPLTGELKTKMDGLEKKFAKQDPRYDWSEMKDAEADRVGAHYTKDLWLAEKFPKETKAGARGLGGDVGQLMSDIAATRRIVGLTNHAVILRQVLQQHFGNVVTDLIAGRLSSIPKMFDIKDLGRIYRGLSGKPELSSTAKMYERRGLPVIPLGNRSLVMDHSGIENPALRKMRDIFAPQRNANLFALSDNIHGDSLERTPFLSMMRKEEKALPQRVQDTYAAFVDAKSKHQMPAVHPQALVQATQDAIAKYKLRGEPLSDITPKQLYDALMTEMKKAPDFYAGSKGQPGTAEGAHWFADRVARDWSGVNNTARQLARKNRDYVAFTFDRTHLDDVVGTAFLYHMWTSRATALYAKEMAKKPWMAGTFYRLGEQLYQEADQNNYPDWLKMYTRVLHSPAGITLMMSPTDMLGTMGLFADWNDQLNGLGASKGDLTALGQLRTIFPLVTNPVFDYGALLFNAFGKDARMTPNILGVEPVFSLGAKVLNLLNANNMLPPGMGRDAGENIVPFPELPITQVAQSLAQLVAGRAPVDLGASFKVNTRYFLEDVLREEHPEWATDPEGENKLRDAAIEAEAAYGRGQESPEWNEAERRTIDMEMTGPDFPGVPEPLRGLFRMGTKLVSPIRMTAQPQTKTLRNYGFDSVDGGNQPSPTIGHQDSYDLKDIKNRPYDTLDAAMMNADVENWFNIGTDSGLQEATRMFSAIGKGEPGTFTLGGTTYTNESLSLMSTKDRYKVAEQYLNSQGFTDADKDAYYQARQDAIKAHPDLAGFFAYKDYAEQYPGGVKGFTDAAVRTSPSFARYMQQTGYTPGTDDYYKAALYGDAYFAIEGRRSSVYDPTVLPDAGTVPGLPHGETFAMKWALDDAVDQAASSSAKGDGTSFDSYVSDVEKSVSDLYYGQKLLDQTFPGTGLRAGVDRLPYDMYQAMLGVWKANGVYVPDKGDVSYEYLDWLANNATAPDHSVKAFLNQRDTASSSGSPSIDTSQTVTPEMVAEQRGITLVDATMPKRDTSGAIDTSGFPKATLNAESEARTGPSLTNPMNAYFYPGDILSVSDIQGDWAQVVGPDGAIGWVPTAMLQKAA